MDKVYLIGNAHLDPVWLWRWQEGYAEIKATFAAALDRIEEFGDRGFVFTAACAGYYEYVEQNCPELFDRIKKAVADGKWRIEGGMWIQPDCNAPSGESFARHALYSQRYFREKFGVQAATGYNVDSFGHAGSLPQLLRESGLTAYVFMRPGTHEKALPYDTFIWESRDGTRIPTFRIPFEYTCDGSPERVSEKLDRCAALADSTGLPIMCFYGVGNHGGGPTVMAVNECLRRMESDKRFVFASPDDFFSDLRADGRIDSLPVVADDLQHHASGCYATTAPVKAANRRAEHRLYAAESAMTVAADTLGLPFEKDMIKQAWERVLFNQFHDVMGGCSIREAYADAMEQYGEALSVSARLYNAAVQKLTWAINTMPEGGTRLSKDFNWSTWERDNGGAPLVVWNPHAFPVETEVQLRATSKAITDADGKPVARQIVRASRTNNDDKYDTIFRASLPPFGYKTYFAYTASEPSCGEAEFAAVSAIEDAKSVTLENELISVSADRHTGLLSITDKATGRRLADSCGAVDVRDDFYNDTWAHAVFRYDHYIGSAHDAVVSLVESGPLRASLRVSMKWGGSTVTQTYSIVSGCAEVSCAVYIDWHDALKVVKLGFRVENASECEYEIPYGSIVRECDGEEEPGHSWVDLRAQDHGLTVTNDAKYSYSAEGDTLWLTALRTAFYGDHFGKRDGTERAMDLGENEFNYVLTPHLDFDPLAASRRARLLNLAPAVVAETWHKGPLPLEKSFASADNAVIGAIKPAEDGNGTIVRVFNPYGAEVRTNVSLAFLNESFGAKLGAFEVATYRVDGSGVTRVDFTEKARD